jgi:hypothetical protein
MYGYLMEVVAATRPRRRVGVELPGGFRRAGYRRVLAGTFIYRLGYSPVLLLAAVVRQRRR